MTKPVYYKDIKDNYKSSWHIPYEVLLNTHEWKDFRKTIIARDNNICTLCHKEQLEKSGQQYFRKPTEEEIIENSKEILVDLLGDGSWLIKMKPAIVVGIPTDNPTLLHVHHKYYVFGNLPWDYKNEALITVCHDCHIAIHDKEKISVYIDNSFKEKLDLTPCSRCNGTGFLERYLHFQNGICFRCNGRKFEEFI